MEGDPNQLPFVLQSGQPTEYELGLMFSRYKGLTEIGHSGLPLFPSGPDRFVGSNWRAELVQMKRDKHGKVVGMSWTGNRVRNLWFARV
jgi:hypothetical protein